MTYDTISFERKRELARLIKENPFSLPKGFTLQKTVIPGRGEAYVFRHYRMGELGRLLILPHPGGKTQFVVEVAGSEKDPMTKKRRALLEPVSAALIKTMSLILGINEGAPAPYSAPQEEFSIMGQEINCEQCGAVVAFLIHAAGAVDTGQLEDYARLMHDKVLELNVPTWVIGDEKEIKIGRELLGRSLVLKIWPERAESKYMLSIEINSKLDKLIADHCD